MSASREEKIQSRAQRDEKRRQEEQKDRRAMVLYSVIGVIVVVAAVAMIVWNSGLLQRRMTAVEINGAKYTSADVEYYYTAAYNSILNTYMNQYYMYPFDPSLSTKKQVYDEESGQTWYDYLMETALNNLKSDAALSAKATAEGYTLSETAQAQLDSALAQVETTWVSRNYTSRDAYIRAAFGSYMTYDRLVELFHMDILASDYASATLEGMEHSDADYQAYYSEHAGQLDTFSYHQFLFQAQVPTTDDQGNQIEMTDEEKAAALEELKAEQKALAEELKAKLDAGEDAGKLAEEYADQLYSSVLDRASTGSSSNILSSSYADWLMDSGRKAGDTTLSESERDSATYNYYVVQYLGRELDTTPTANVRHILVAAEQDEGASEPTQEQYDAAYEQAETLLGMWESGEATEDSFAEMASTSSADTYSASNGGLISNITANSGYVDTFTDWARDPARQPGDTAIVQNTGSSIKGWHIMYYVSSGEPIWKQSVSVALANQDYADLVAEASEGWTVNTGMGMNFISG